MTPVVPRQRVIPFGGWLAAGIVFLLFFLGLSLAFVQSPHDIPEAVRFIIPIVVPLVLAGYTLLIGYVNGDARRRGMRYVMWTLLAIFLANGIGLCAEPARHPRGGPVHHPDRGSAGPGRLYAADRDDEPDR